MKKRIAIIDLGTNTFHLLIREYDGNDFVQLFKEKIPVRLGMGGISKGVITADAHQRAIDALIHFKSVIDQYQVDIIKGTGTSALRNASNGQSVVDDIFKKTGISIEIISGEKEAKLIYEGVKQAMDIGSTTSMIMDIGGGSVEFIICDGQHIYWQQSFEIGGQRLLDKFHQTDPIPQSSIIALDEYLNEKLLSLKSALEEFKPEVLIGASGTFDTLCEILEYGENDLLDRTEMELPLKAFHSISEDVIAKSRAERLIIPGMIEMRVDMIVVSCCLIKHVINLAQIEKIRVSTYALKEGLLSTVV